jgi:hypothetical protein
MDMQRQPAVVMPKLRREMRTSSALAIVLIEKLTKVLRHNAVRTTAGKKQSPSLSQQRRRRMC